MRMSKLFLFFVAVIFASPVAAQDWIEYVNREEMFELNFPSEPTIEAATYESEFHAQLHGKIFRASDPLNDYTVTIINYGDTTVEYPYNYWDMHGSMSPMTAGRRSTA